VSGLGLAQQKRMSVHENVKTTHNFEVECQKIVGVKQGVIGLWEEGEIRDSFPSIEGENDIFNLLSQVEIGIYNEEAFNHECMDKELYSIRANCPWDIEHGIEFEIKLEEVEKSNASHS
jgi:carbamate kinase